MKPDVENLIVGEIGSGEMAKLGAFGETFVAQEFLSEFQVLVDHLLECVLHGLSQRHLVFFHHVLRVLQQSWVRCLRRAGERFVAAPTVPARFSQILRLLWLAHGLDAVRYEAVFLPHQHAILIREVKELR